MYNYVKHSMLKSSGRCITGRNLKNDLYTTSRPKVRTNRTGTILVCLVILLTTLAVSGAIIYLALRRNEKTKVLQSQEKETESLKKENLEIDRKDIDIGEERAVLEQFSKELSKIPYRKARWFPVLSSHFTFKMGKTS